MNTQTLTNLVLRSARLIVSIGSLVFSGTAFSAATIVIQNGNAPGVGFNDPTPVAPVGGNTGTTLGQQRLNAFAYAASKWGASLSSNVTITVSATMEPLTCTATSAVLGSAGAITIWRDFFGAPLSGYWYSAALANTLFGSDIDSSTSEIRARFNSNLGNTGCLTGIPFYLGLDNNHGNAVDLVTVLEHEFGHGLGFQTFTSGSTGLQAGDEQEGRFPSIFDYFLYDTVIQKHWDDMTNAERQASAVKTGKLVWDGPKVWGAVPDVLSGTPLLTVSSPSKVAGNYSVGTASFGPALGSPGVTAEVMPVVDTAPNLGLACNPLSSLNAIAVNGKIAMVDRGICTFTTKVKNAQNAGAKGVIVVHNEPGSPPDDMGGSDPTITIPSVRISQADGNTLKAVLATRSRTHSGMFATLGVNLSVRAGANAAGFALMYTPNPLQSGSSVSHWDTSAVPNQLMEPAINSDLTHELKPPEDLTLPLLQDIGWPTSP